MGSRMENMTSPSQQKGHSHVQEILVGSAKLRASHQPSSLLQLPWEKTNQCPGEQQFLGPPQLAGFQPAGG